MANQLTQPPTGDMGNDARVFAGQHYRSSVNVADSEGRAMHEPLHVIRRYH